MSGGALVTAVECFVPDIGESRPPHRVSYGGLLGDRGNLIVQAATEKNWSAEEFAAWIKAAVTLGQLLFVDPG